MSGLRAFGALGALVLTLGITLAACASQSDEPPEHDGGELYDDRYDSDASESDAGLQTPKEGGEAGGSCGDGDQDSAEECDDGNLVDNDGCSSYCKMETRAPNDFCPGVTLALAPASGQPRLLVGSVSGSTSGAYHHFESGCGGGSGRDVVYAITPPSSGRAIVKVTADYPAIVSARGDCLAPDSESKCSGIETTSGGATTIDVPVFAGMTTFLIVDGYGGTSGAFKLDVEVSTAVCGNGIAELPEECDDGNTQDGDGCTAECMLAEGGVATNCPGLPFPLSGPPGARRKISFAGNTRTTGARTQGSIGCFHWDGPNVVYAVKSDIAGSVHATLTAGYTKANLHARTDCGSSSFQIGCTQGEAPGALALDFPVRTDQWFYLFVDGHRSSGFDYGGPFSLDVTVTPSACGNGVLDGDEQCDDGDRQDGDGCSSACRLEPLPATDTCPGVALALEPRLDGSRKLTIAGTTSFATSDAQGCNLASGSAPDVVYAITPDIDGLLTAEVAGPFNSIVFVRATCGDPTTNLSCSYNATATTIPFGLDGLGSVPKSTKTPVVAGATYYVYVDSSVSSGRASGGPFKLDLTVTPAVCGNGVVDGREQCDDGGAEDNDGCSATCQNETSGPRTCATAEVLSLAPSGVPGEYATTVARGTTNHPSAHNFTTVSRHPCQAPGREAFFEVTAPIAGVLRASATSAAFDAVLGFRKPCATSGNAIVCKNDAPKGTPEAIATPVAAGERIWIVVDAASAADFGRFGLTVTLTPSGCGDGFFVPSPEEECDDGNTASGDGCSSVCRLEPNPAADKCPGVTLPLSGTGLEPRKGVITLDTRVLLPDYVSLCGGNARDGVVKVVPPIHGFLHAEIRGMAGGLVHARRTCGDPTTEIKKSLASTCPNVVYEVIEFSVTAGTEYYLFVDGFDGATGVPTLDVSVVP